MNSGVKKSKISQFSLYSNCPWLFLFFYFPRQVSYALRSHCPKKSNRMAEFKRTELRPPLQIVSSSVRFRALFDWVWVPLECSHCTFFFCELSSQKLAEREQVWKHPYLTRDEMAYIICCTLSSTALYSNWAISIRSRWGTIAMTRRRLQRRLTLHS